MKKRMGAVICVAILIFSVGCSSLGSSSEGGFWGISLPDNSLPKKGSKDESASSLLEDEPSQLVGTEISNQKLNFQFKDIDTGENLSLGGTSVEFRNCYNGIEDGAEKECYNQISKRVNKISTKKNSKGYYVINKCVIKNSQMSENSIRRVVYAFKNDNPSVFWITNSFGYKYTNGNMEVELYSYLSPQECTDAIKKLKDSIKNKVLDKMEYGLSEFERELYLHDKLIEICNYDYDALSQGIISEDKWQVFTAYGAIVSGKAVCEGYSRAMQLLLNHVGIQSDLITGVVGSSTLHMWNLIKIDGNWYHLDSTWNETEKIYRYDYFNVTDKIIKIDHEIDPEYIAGNGVQDFSMDPERYNFELPECTSKKANYFNVKAVKISSLNKDSDEEMINKLRQMVYKGEVYLSILIGENMNYTSTIERIFSKVPYKFFYYIKEANKSIETSKQIDSSKVMYVECKNQRAITIDINYSI